MVPLNSKIITHHFLPSVFSVKRHSTQIYGRTAGVVYRTRLPVSGRLPPFPQCALGRAEIRVASATGTGPTSKCSRDPRTSTQHYSRLNASKCQSRSARTRQSHLLHMRAEHDRALPGKLKGAIPEHRVAVRSGPVTHRRRHISTAIGDQCADQPPNP